MARVLAALVLGVLLGATAAWLLRPSPLALPDLGELPSTIAAEPAANAVVTAAAREGGADFYRQLADANTTDLAAMIRQAAAEPASTERELALAVLLKRYSELDALGAVRLAREARVGGMALSAVYGAWARKAPAQALAALSTVENPDSAASVAVALITALGNDAAAFDRVADVLAAREGEDLLAGVMPIAPVGPAAPTMSFISPRSALGLMVQRWADLDPRRALTVAHGIYDEQVRRTLESAALRSLARIAPDEAFAHLSTASADPEQLGVLGGAIAELARANPERVLASASQLPRELRNIALSQALPQLAERDPLAAAQYLETLGLGPERQSLLQVVARNYGKKDAAAALAWARSLPDRDNLVGAVLSGVAEQDPQRALDLALDLTAPRERMQAIQRVAMMGARDDATAEAFANRLLASDDRQLRESVGMMLASTWASRSPEGAMRWLMTNGRDMPPMFFMQVAQQLAMRDPRTALAQSAQVPAAAREQWLQGVAQGYAQNDPRGAIDWLGQFRGEPWHDRAVTTVAMTIADRDGAAAARLIDELSAGSLSPQLANAVAMNWANRDAPAAAAWALERPNEQERSTAIRSVVTVWSNQDPAAARQWMLRLPQGAMRDGALTTVLATTAMQRPGALDTALLNAFTSDAARQQAVLQVVQGLAYNDPTRARSVVDGYLTDPVLRAQAERMLDAARNDTRQRPPFQIGITGAR